MPTACLQKYFGPRRSSCHTTRVGVLRCGAVPAFGGLRRPVTAYTGAMIRSLLAFLVALPIGGYLVTKPLSLAPQFGVANFETASGLWSWTSQPLPQGTTSVSPTWPTPAAFQTVLIERIDVTSDPALVVWLEAPNGDVLWYGNLIPRNVNSQTHQSVKLHDCPLVLPQLLHDGAPLRNSAREPTFAERLNSRF